MDENLNPFDKSRKPCARGRWRAAGARRKKQKPRLGRGFRKRQSGDCYLAGAVDESVVVDFLLCLLWLLLLLLLWPFL
jgi:hypothetical protein